jgi:hypothetical protein
MNVINVKKRGEEQRYRKRSTIIYRGKTMSTLFDHSDGHILNIGKFRKAYANDKWRRHYKLSIDLNHLLNNIEWIVVDNDEEGYQQFIDEINHRIEIEYEIMEHIERSL